MLSWRYIVLVLVRGEAISFLEPYRVLAGTGHSLFQIQPITALRFKLELPQGFLRKGRTADARATEAEVREAVFYFILACTQIKE